MLSPPLHTVSTPFAESNDLYLACLISDPTELHFGVRDLERVPTYLVLRDRQYRLASLLESF